MAQLAGGIILGWRLARHAWHHGYATEAARAALEVAFDGIGLDEIWSMTAVVNEPSQAVMRRLGLVEVARFNHPRVPAGHLLQPHVTYHRGLRVRKASRIQSNISDLLRAAPGLNRAHETGRLQVERPVVAAVFLDDAFRDLMAHSFINADDHDYAPARKD